MPLPSALQSKPVLAAAERTQPCSTPCERFGTRPSGVGSGHVDRVDPRSLYCQSSAGLTPVTSALKLRSGGLAVAWGDHMARTASTHALWRPSRIPSRSRCTALGFELLQSAQHLGIDGPASDPKGEQNSAYRTALHSPLSQSTSLLARTSGRRQLRLLANAMRGSSRSGSRVESARHIEVPGKPVEFCLGTHRGLPCLLYLVTGDGANDAVSPNRGFLHVAIADG